jgi:hypothetical protein
MCVRVQQKGCGWNLINMLRVSGQTDLMLAAPQNFFYLDQRLAMVDD